jgi:phage portal protein BeeE
MTLRPTSRPTVPAATRAQYTRTSADLLVNDPDGWMSDGEHGPVWWIGLDSGGGRYPIGPNGPNPLGIEGVPAIIRATALITGPLTAAPFRVLEGGYGGQPLARPRWITDPQLLRPDAGYDVPGVPAVGSVLAATRQLARGEFWSVWLRAAIWWGMGPLLFVPDATGQPTPGTLVVINPRTLSTRKVDGSLRWVIAGDDEGSEVVFGRDGRVSIGGVEWRLVVLRNPHSPVDDDGLTRGVFELCPQAFRLGGQIDAYSSSTFRSGVPAGYLRVETPGLQQPQADELKSSWMRAHGGDRRSIAVLNSTTTFTPISLSPIDAALGESKRLNIADVAFAFGLDPITLGVSLANSATYNNVSEAWRNHRDFGLTLWISGVQDTLSSLLPGTRGVAINLDSFANPPLKERVETGATAVNAGLLTVNEWRDLEGLPPLPEPAPEPPQLTQPDGPTAEPAQVSAVRRLRPAPLPLKAT